MKYESTFNAIDKILRNEAGCSNELDYIEQTSWLLFLKYLDDLESELEISAQLDGKTYKRIVTGFNRWDSWAAPKNAKGELDVINAMTGDDLVKFVNEKLFPSLAKFKQTAADTRTLEYKIGEIFSEIRNKIQSGYNLREIINKIDSLKFSSADDKHEMTVLYEDKIRRMGNAGRNGGEYYTPRPLIRSIIKVVNPKIGETIYDPACGSAGFLCEAYNYMLDKKKSASDYDTLQKNTFFGKEKKPLPYIIATMNMIFHGIKAPNITRGNTLSENLSAIQEKDRHNVILANPPFGGSERQDVQQNFAIKTSETAYMFMQHFVKMLKAGGRAGIVIKNSFLNNSDAKELRKMLLEECNLHTILDLPAGVFTGAGVHTVVLFFTKGESTKHIWYYQVDKHYTKTHSLSESDMDDFILHQKDKSDGLHSWSISIKDLGENYDLSVKNPFTKEHVDERKPNYISKEIENLVGELLSTQTGISEFLKQTFEYNTQVKRGKISDVCTVIAGQSPKGSAYNSSGKGIEFHQGKKAFGDSVIGQSNVYTTEVTKIAEPGDILMSVRAPVGPTNLTDRKICIGRGLAAIRCSEEVLPQYVLFALRNIESQIVGNDGAVFNSINKTMIEKLPIPIVSTDEQKRVVEYINNAFSKIDTINAKISIILKENKSLKQSVLKQLYG